MKNRKNNNKRRTTGATTQTITTTIRVNKQKSLNKRKDIYQEFFLFSFVSKGIVGKQTELNRTEQNRATIERRRRLKNVSFTTYDTLSIKYFLECCVFNLRTKLSCALYLVVLCISTDEWCGGGTYTYILRTAGIGCTYI